MQKSIFDPSQTSGVVGGLDNFTTPTGHSFSSMPESLIDGKVEADEDGDEAEENVVDGPCAGDQSEEAVCQIAEALDERRHDEAAPKQPVYSDGPE